MAQSIADEYSGSEPTEGVKLNGKLTLGENTADNSGLRIALMALESTLSQKPSHTDSNELTPQQEFFISYAETWVLERNSPVSEQDGAIQSPCEPHRPARMVWYPTCHRLRHSSPGG